MIIPTELLAYQQWIVRNDRKIPFDAKTRRPASCTDPSTWSDYRVASRALSAFRGLSFAVTSGDPFVAIDIDNCIGAGADPERSSFAQHVIRELDSYTEVSPSGRGIRILVKAKLPPGRRKNNQIEMYDRDRFVSITGDHVPGTPTTIEERSAKVSAMHRLLFPQDHAVRPVGPSSYRPTADDQELIAKAMQAPRMGQKFKEAWQGGTASWGGNQSDADLYLAGALMFLTGHDADRADRLFRQSGLMRPKWDERRGSQTYAQRTLEMASR